MGKIILTGDRPTGRLHLGHYVGSLRRRVELQESGEFERIFIMIADAQALTDNADNPEKVRQNIIEVALDYLSVGLDPKRSTLFIQSQIPELCELSFYYMNLVTVQRLQRNPTVKAEIQLRGFAEGAAEGDTQQKQGIPVGLLHLPHQPGGRHHGIQGHDRPCGRRPGADDRTDPRDRPQVQHGIRPGTRRARDPAAGECGLHASAGHRRQGQDVEIALQLHLPLGQRPTR